MQQYLTIRSSGISIMYYILIFCRHDEKFDKIQHKTRPDGDLVEIFKISKHLDLSLIFGDLLIAVSTEREFGVIGDFRTQKIENF